MNLSSSPSLVAVLLLLLCALGAAVFLWWQRQRRGRGGSERQRAGAKRSAVLLVGECGAGKTVLFHRLVDGVAVASVTSMKENEASNWSVGERSGLRRTLVDLPGHGRLSYLYRQFAPIAGVVVLVLDALALQRQCRAVAERLYDLLTVPESLLVPVVVACNKRDILTAADAAAVRAEVLRELNELRTTRAVQPRAVSANKLGVGAAGGGAGGGGSGGDGDDDDDDENGATLLGVDGEPLTWEQVPVSVEFVECSGRTGEGIDLLVEAIGNALTSQ
jgi:signal recognition particle receptor subunit beta